MLHRSVIHPRNCATTRRSLSAFLDGEVGSGLSASIRQHLGTCARCARRLEELVNISAAAHDLVGEGLQDASGPTPDRLVAIVRRLSENRRLRLELVLRRVLAFRILRAAGAAGAGGAGGSVHDKRGSSPAEEHLMGQARLLVRELGALDPTGERLALVRLEHWLKGGSYEDLRSSGLLEGAPPPLRWATDSRRRARILRWARRALLESPESSTANPAAANDWLDPTPCCD